MPLNFSDIEINPSLLTFEVQLNAGESVVMRPLESDDINLLTEFLQNLSIQTRENYTLESYDFRKAQEMCDAISKYDKLRFVVINQSTEKLIALFEFSFDIPGGDRLRFKNYNLNLNAKTDCRIGPCILDAYQNKGVGTALFPYLKDITKQFDKKRMILWGGVFKKTKKQLIFISKTDLKY